MSPVLIECPSSHELVPTGLVAQDLDELEDENILWDCAACHGDHPWTPADAVLSSSVRAR